MTRVTCVIVNYAIQVVDGLMFYFVSAKESL